MPYTPNPTDYTQPVDTVDAGTAAAEFRALKAFLQGQSAGSLTILTSIITPALTAYNATANGDLTVSPKGTGVIKLKDTVTGATAIQTKNNPGASEVGMLLYVNDGATVTQRQVSVGIADSGGAGYRLLRVPN